MVAKLAAIVAVLAFAALQLRRRPWLGFAILWFALALLPTHSFLARLELANDRQLYLAMAGPALALGVAIACAACPRACRYGRRSRLAVHPRLRDVRARGRLFERVPIVEGHRAREPANARAWNNLGYALAAEGDVTGARAAYEKALAIEPSSPRARGNLDALPR